MFPSIAAALKHRSGTKRWNDVVYEAAPTLSQLFWRPRSTPHLKDKYLPTHYRPNMQAATSGTAAAAAAAAEPGTPKRKRKPEGESTPGGSARRVRRVTEEDEEGEGSPPKKARASSAKKQPRKVKEEATPTRSRLSRGAKAGEHTHASLHALRVSTHSFAFGWLSLTPVYFFCLDTLLFCNQS